MRGSNVRVPAVRVPLVRRSGRASEGQAMSADVVPDLDTLIAALRAVCEAFGAASAAASYVSPLQGRLVTLHVTAGGIAYLADEDGNVVVVPGSADE